jgi:pimeloyl-ACP methyl ester carboxylesterase
VQPWPDDERELFLQDAPADVAVATLARSRTQTRRVMDEPWPLDAWPDVPTRFLLCREDRCFPAAWLQRVVRDRLRITADEIDGGHMPYVSRPAELAERIDPLRGLATPSAPPTAHIVACVQSTVAHTQLRAAARRIARRS